MIKIKLSEVREVEECMVDAANNLLKRGYEVLKIVKMQNNNEEHIIYVLGKG